MSNVRDTPNSAMSAGISIFAPYQAIGSTHLAHRIHTFGASGSGTTSLGRAIARQLGCTHLDTDSYYWHKTNTPFTEKRCPAKRIELIKRDTKDVEDWVLSGSICSWGDPLLESFTLAVLVLLDTDIRMKRLADRERHRYGNRIDHGGDRYESHVEFMDWAQSYDTAKAPIRSLDLHLSWAERLKCPVLQVNSLRTSEELAVQILGSEIS